MCAGSGVGATHRSLPPHPSRCAHARCSWRCVRLRSGGPASHKGKRRKALRTIRTGRPSQPGHRDPCRPSCRPSFVSLVCVCCCCAIAVSVVVVVWCCVLFAAAPTTSPRVRRLSFCFVAAGGRVGGQWPPLRPHRARRDHTQASKEREREGEGERTTEAAGTNTTTTDTSVLTTRTSGDGHAPFRFQPPAPLFPQSHPFAIRIADRRRTHTLQRTSPHSLVALSHIDRP